MSLATEGETNSIIIGWRNVLPARWLPLVVLVIGVFGVEIAYQRDMAEAQNYQFYLEPLAWVGFCVLAALFVMTHSPVWIRLLLLLVVTLSEVVCDLLCDWLLQSEFFLPDGEFQSWKHLLYEVVQRFGFDLRGFALVCGGMHATTALFRIFVSARSAKEVEQTPIRFGSIGEWCYFALLVALVYSPQLTPWQWAFPADESEARPMVTWNSMQLVISAYALFPVIGVSFVGLLVLPAWNSLWFRILVCIVHFSILMVLLAPDQSVRLALLPNLLFDFGPVAFLTLPHWLLIRMAGYWLSSPRGWVTRAPEASSTSLFSVTEQ